MRRLGRVLCTFVLLVGILPWGSMMALPATGAPLADALRISQVYGGGGGNDAPYTHDYVELFNAGTTEVSLNNLSIQYASATGTGNFGASATQLTELPDVVLAPGQYFLVQIICLKQLTR